jgi:hypothetical protein
VYYAIIESIFCYLLAANTFAGKSRKGVEVLVVGVCDHDQQLYLAWTVLRRT